MEKNKIRFGILLPVKRKYTKLIIDGVKMAEARKKIPNIELPCPVYIYESLGTQRFVSEELWGDKYPDWFGYETFKETAPYTYKRLITEGRGSIVARFTLEHIETIHAVRQNLYSSDRGYLSSHWMDNDLLQDLQLTHQELIDYGKRDIVYAWRIDDLQLVNEVNLSDINIKHVPQSYMYLTKEQVEEIERLNDIPF